MEFKLYMEAKVNQLPKFKTCECYFLMNHILASIHDIKEDELFLYYELLILELLFYYLHCKP